MRATDFDQQVAANQQRFAAQKDWGARLKQQQMSNPKVTGNPAMATNALLAQKKGFANAGAWYQDIMDRLGNIDPKVYGPAQKELDQYEANIKKDTQHATPGDIEAWRNKTAQQVRKDYKAVGPYPVTEIGHSGAACTTGNPPLEENTELARLKSLSGILVR